MLNCSQNLLKCLSKFNLLKYLNASVLFLFFVFVAYTICRTGLRRIRGEFAANGAVTDGAACGALDFGST